MMAIHNFCRRILRLLGLVTLGMVALVLLLSPVPAALVADDKAADEKAVEQIKGDERIAVLRFLAAHNEANYRKIETWRGKYHFVDRAPQQIQLAVKDASSPQPMRDVMAIHEGTVEFALDVAADKLWSEYQEDGSKVRFLSLDGKEAITPLGHNSFNEKEILTADRLTKLPNVEYGPLPQHPDDPNHVRKTSSRLARQEAYQPSERMRDLGVRLDPRRFYSTGTAPIWEALNAAIRALTGGDGAERRALVSKARKITKCGIPGEREYKLTMRYFNGSSKDEHKLPLDVCRFAEKNEYLPVEQTFYASGGKIHQHRSWLYQRTNGVLIPKEFHLTINDAGNGQLVLDRHLRFVEGILNEPLPDDIFSTDHLGLAKGDRFEDKVENRLFVSDGNKLLPADQYAVAVKGSHPAWWIIWINGCLVFAVLAFWSARRYLRWRKVKAGS